MKPQDIIKKSSNYLADRNEVIFAYLFGSFANHRATPLSDIDIAVFLDDENNDLADSKLELIAGLGCELETDRIDLVILNKAPESLLLRIMHKKIILVDRKPFKRHQFESLVMRKCIDFSYMENKILERRYLNG